MLGAPNGSPSMTERKKARNSQSPTTNSTRGPKSRADLSERVAVQKRVAVPSQAHADWSNRGCAEGEREHEQACDKRMTGLDGAGRGWGLIGFSLSTNDIIEKR